MVFGPEWTGAEASALSDVQIEAALDDEQEARRARRRRSKGFRETLRQPSTAAAASEPIPEEETARRVAKLAAAASMIERFRAGDRRALEHARAAARTFEGRQRRLEAIKQLGRECLRNELTEANAPLRLRWETARARLRVKVAAGQIAASVWLSPSKELRPLSPAEARATFSARQQRNRVMFDGEPGWFVVWEPHIDRVFGAPPSPERAPRANPKAEQLPVKRQQIKNRSALEDEINKLVENGHKSGAQALFETLSQRGYTRQEVRAACHRLFPGRRPGRLSANAPEKNRPAQ